MICGCGCGCGRGGGTQCTGAEATFMWFSCRIQCKSLAQVQVADAANVSSGFKCRSAQAGYYQEPQNAAAGEDFLHKHKHNHNGM